MPWFIQMTGIIMSSQMRVDLQPAFILHSRPYRDTSLLVDVLSQNHGRISGVLRGVRSRKSRLKGLARLFLPLLMSWSGRTQLMTIHTLEPAGSDYWLTGKALISGFYINELLIRLFHAYDPHPDIYAIYARALAQLHATPDAVEPALRLFEFDLLKALGFGVVLNKEHDKQGSLLPDHFYTVQPDHGVVYVAPHLPNDGWVLCWSGKSLMAIENRDFSDPQTQRDAKQLIRLLLQPLLGGRALNARQYYSC